MTMQRTLKLYKLPDVSDLERGIYVNYRNLGNIYYSLNLREAKILLLDRTFFLTIIQQIPKIVRRFLSMDEDGIYDFVLPQRNS